MEYLLGIDFGGGSSKATLLDINGNIVCTSSQEYPTAYPVDGWCEQNPKDLFDACVINIKNILEKSGIDARSILAVAVDSATHMAVLLDEKDRVIRPVIHWADRRSVEESAFLRENYLDMIERKCLNFPSPLWTLPQLMWLKKHEPESIGKTRRILFMKDYIRHRLSGDYLTDSIEAMGAMLFDEETGRWSGELCELAGLDVGIMPEITAPATVVGTITEEASKITGLSVRTKVVAGTTDTALEVYASGSVSEGQATIKLATAGRICPVTDHGVCNEMLVNYRHVVEGKWYPGTANKTSASSYRWYRDVFCVSEAEAAGKAGMNVYDYMNEAARLVPPGSDGVCFHPYLMGESTPYNDNNLRASFTGVSSFHGKGHFSRAVMEGVCFSLRDSLDFLKTIGIAPTEANIIGGGGQSPFWAQMTSDILNMKLTKMRNDDSSLGSAMLAGTAAGVFSDFEDSVRKCCHVLTHYEPNPENVEKYSFYFERYKAIHDALAPVYRRYAM